MTLNKITDAHITVKARVDDKDIVLEATSDEISIDSDVDYGDAEDFSGNFFYSHQVKSYTLKANLKGDWTIVETPVKKKTEYGAVLKVTRTATAVLSTLTVDKLRELESRLEIPSTATFAVHVDNSSNQFYTINSNTVQINPPYGIDTKIKYKVTFTWEEEV